VDFWALAQFAATWASVAMIFPPTLMMNDAQLIIGCPTQAALHKWYNNHPKVSIRNIHILPLFCCFLNPCPTGTNETPPQKCSPAAPGWGHRRRRGGRRGTDGAACRMGFSPCGSDSVHSSPIINRKSSIVNPRASRPQPEIRWVIWRSWIRSETMPLAFKSAGHL
jgi:hypothetical protein